MTGLYEAVILISPRQPSVLNPPPMHIEGPMLGMLERIWAYRQVRFEFDPSFERQGPLDPDQAVVWGLHHNYVHGNGSNYDLPSVALAYRAQDDYHEHECHPVNSQNYPYYQDPCYDLVSAGLGPKYYSYD